MISIIVKFKCLLNRIKNFIIGNNMVKIAPDARIRSGVKIYAKNAKITIKNKAGIDRNCNISAISNGEITIGKNVYFNRSCILVSRKEIIIGDNTICGPNVCFYDHDHCFDSTGISKDKFNLGSIIIEEGCWIGAGCIILRDTHIGEGSVIAAGTVIKGNFPKHSIVRTNLSYNIRKIEEKA